MPGMVVFGRRWRISSDDLVFPGAFELFIRAVWWIVTLVLYTNRKGRFDCQGGANLHNYLIVLLVLLAVIILTLCAVVYFSAQGTIMNPGPRRSVPALVYLRALLYVPELVWACLGAVWVSDNSTGCEPAEVGFVIGAVVSSWIILLSMVVGVLVVFDPLGSQKPGALPDAPLDVRDLESSGSSRLFYTVASRVRESRLRLLCCCLPQDDNHRTAFSSIAQLMLTRRSCFQDTDLVPSDIAAGLSLLHQEQDKVEHCRDPDEVLSHKPSPPIVSLQEDLEVELEKAAHCMQFAAAAYGWPLYVYSNPLTGLCRLSGDCCRNRHVEHDLIGGENLGCHFSSILQSTGLQYRDFIHISVHNQVNISRMCTVSSSRLLSVLSKALADYSKQFVVSVVLGKDLVPRLSIPNMEDLKRRLLKMVSNCSKPKYKILMHGCWYELFGGTPDDFPTELETRREELLNQPLLGEESLLLRRSSTYQSLSPDESPPRLTHLPLYLPGRVLHITEDRPARRHCFSQVRYRAEWSSEESFCNVLISPRMIADHMPDVVLRALRSLTHEHPLALCSSSISNSHLNVI
uniref:Diacylglycerol lipase, beta n=1 Tax=Sinocyclocheilus anshuiensis TaxID=1608454 RepID=A0A671LSC4_9TELE